MFGSINFNYKILASYCNATTTVTVTADTSNYPAGMYLVVVRENEAIISQQKLIIE